MDFSDFNLDARLMRAIADSRYEQPTPIQAEAIPVVLAGSDLIGTAQTGTGKTAAFVLPILQRILNTPPDSNGPTRTTRDGKTVPLGHHRALIVTPTRELAEQINDAIKVLAKYTNIRSETIYGGVASRFQERALRDGVEILVACPGRLLDHIDAGLCKLDKIDVLVLDEADRMFDMGFLPSVKRILGFVNRNRQTLLFSATFPREVEDLAGSSLRNPKRIAIGRPQAATTITHALYPVTMHLKKKMLIALLKKTDAYAMLVFTRTKHRAEALARQLVREGFKTTSLHSDRSQSQRQAALNGFKSGKFQVMVATDIAARGIDVETISHVINYDIPDTVDAYVHRIGRTGRAEREGDAFTLVTPEDGEMVRDIERALGKKIERKTLEGFDYTEPLADGNPNSPNTARGPQRSPQGQGRPQRDFQRDSRGPRRDAGRGAQRPAQRPSNGNGASVYASPVVAEIGPDGMDNDVQQPRPEVLERLHGQTSGDLRRARNHADLRRGSSSGTSGGSSGSAGGSRGGQSRRPQGAGNSSFGSAGPGARGPQSGAQKRKPLQRGGSRSYMSRDERKYFG